MIGNNTLNQVYGHSLIPLVLLHTSIDTLEMSDRATFVARKEREDPDQLQSLPSRSPQRDGMTWRRKFWNLYIQ
jgi:hypothetical protein